MFKEANALISPSYSNIYRYKERKFSLQYKIYYEREIHTCIKQKSAKVQTTALIILLIAAILLPLLLILPLSTHPFIYSPTVCTGQQYYVKIEEIDHGLL